MNHIIDVAASLLLPFVLFTAFQFFSSKKEIGNEVVVVGAWMRRGKFRVNIGKLVFASLSLDVCF
jgi:hypothetical protein